MRRNLKSITTVLSALLLMGAFASVSQAGSFDVKIGPNGSTALIGTNTTNHLFRFSGGEVTCNNVRFEGTETGSPNATKTGIEEITVTPIYTGCTTLGGFIGATIRVNGCKYTVTGASQSALTTNLDIVACTTGKAIEVEIPFTGCIITMPEQGPFEHVVATNNNLPGNEMDFTAAATMTGITYTEGPKCPSPGHHASSAVPSGEYTGAMTFKGFVDNGIKKATHNGHEYDQIQTGSQLEVTAT